MTDVKHLFCAVDYLENDDEMAAYLADCAEEGDPALIAHALGAIARARNLSQLARDTGMTRAGLSRASAGDGNPSFQTIARVAKALGLKISITPANAPRAPETATAARRIRTSPAVA